MTPDPSARHELSRNARRVDLPTRPLIAKPTPFDLNAWRKRQFKPFSITVIGKDKEPTREEMEKAKTYVSEAMNLLYQVRNAMSFRDLQQFAHTQRYTDGTEIRVKSHFGVDRVWIKPPSLAVEAAAESCPTYVVWASWDELEDLPGGFVNATLIFFKRVDNPDGPHFYINPAKEGSNIPPDDAYWWFEFFSVCEEDVRRGIFYEPFAAASVRRAWEFKVGGPHSSGETWTAQDGVTYTRYGATFKAHDMSAMWDVVYHPVTPLNYSASLGQASILRTDFEWTWDSNGYYDWSVRCWIDENGDLDFAIAVATVYGTEIVTKEPSYWVREWVYTQVWDGEEDIWEYDVGVWMKVKKSEFPAGHEEDEQKHLSGGGPVYLIIKYDEEMSAYRQFEVSEGEYNAWTHSGKSIIGLGSASFSQYMVMITHKGMPQKVISLYDTNSVSITETYPGECWGYYDIRDVTYGFDLGYRPYMWADIPFMKTLVIDPSTKSLAGVLIYYGMCIEMENETIEANVKLVDLINNSEEMYNMGVNTYEFYPGKPYPTTWFKVPSIDVTMSCNWGGGIPDYMMIPGWNGPGDVLYRVKGQWFRFPVDPIPEGAPVAPHHQECVYAAEIYKKKEWTVPKLCFDISWYFWFFGPEFRADIQSGEGDSLQTAAVTRMAHPAPPGIPHEVSDFSVGVIPLL